MIAVSWGGFQSACTESLWNRNRAKSKGEKRDLMGTVALPKHQRSRIAESGAALLLALLGTAHSEVQPSAPLQPLHAQHTGIHTRPKCNTCFQTGLPSASLPSRHVQVERRKCSFRARQQKDLWPSIYGLAHLYFGQWDHVLFCQLWLMADCSSWAESIT